MSKNLIWLPGAIEDIVRLRGFIAQKNPKAAQRAASKIKEAAKIILHNPLAGRPVDDLAGFREFVINFGAGSYVLRYNMNGQSIVIVNVWHNREDRL